MSTGIGVCCRNSSVAADGSEYPVMLDELAGVSVKVLDPSNDTMPPQ